MIENTAVRFAWTGDDETTKTESPHPRRTTAKMNKKNKSPVKAVSVGLDVRKHSLADEDLLRFYPGASAPRVCVRPETSRLAMTAFNNWDDCEDVPVIGSVERTPIRMPNEDKITSTRFNRCRGGSYRNAGRKSRQHIKYRRRMAVATTANLVSAI